MTPHARFTLLATALPILLIQVLRAGEDKPPEKPKANAEPELKDPYRDLYREYKPAYVDYIRQNWRPRGTVFYKTDEEMKLSSETSFFTLNEIVASDRADALVLEAIKKEREGYHREAIKLYQMVIDKYPEVLYRVSEYGVFVPIRRYCQRRLLNFPPDELKYYRQLHDARAKEAFEQAQRKNSLSGMAEIVESMMATSYGDNALQELGNAALDFGNYLEALEYFTTLRDYFPDSDCLTEDLQLKIVYCQRKLGDQEALNGQAKHKSTLPTLDLSTLKKLTAQAAPPKQRNDYQHANAPNASVEDYARHPDPFDPLGLQEPVWRETMAESRRDYFSYVQPVVSEHSVIYRHKNIVYSHSILTGELRWTFGLGGRVVWQNWWERQHPQEDVLVQDGLVFAPVHKVGPSLVALDEITGQIRWAYGPMVASDRDEARMRFEAAPAGGNRAVYAGFVFDNIDGDTHVDTEYGVIAFESTTGRILWKQVLCRLKPPKFSAGMAESRRNKIRSFTSPPLYKEGTVYYNTNAGAMAAIDAASGELKWLARYPYYPEVHDAVRSFGSTPDNQHTGYVNLRPHMPMFWLNQRPLMLGENLFIAPVDTRMLMCMDRRTGQVRWVNGKPSEGFAYILGTTSKGELLIATNGRNSELSGSSGRQGSPLYLIDPKTGNLVWKCDFDPILQTDHPALLQPWYQQRSGAGGISYNARWFETAARPYLTENDVVYMMSWTDVSPYWRLGCQIFHLSAIDLRNHEVVHRRRYLSGTLQAHIDWMISDDGPRVLKSLKELPQKDKNVQDIIARLELLGTDTVPVNKHGPFMPFSRMVFERFGQPFELRMGPREVSMVYDREKVKAAVAKGEDPDILFARAELSLGEGHYAKASELLNLCLEKISAEDLDFRALVNQQLYMIHRRLVQRAIFRSVPADELEHGLGMSRTVGTQSEEIETLFTLADAYERLGQPAQAARCLRNIVSVYGHHEYPVSPMIVQDVSSSFKTAQEVLSGADARVNEKLYTRELKGAVARMQKGMPLYTSTVSPLPKSMTVRSGELAVQRLVELMTSSREFAAQADKEAASELQGKSLEERLLLLRSYPATQASQKTLDDLFAQAQQQAGTEEGRKLLWALADTARLCALKVPGAATPLVAAPEFKLHRPDVAAPYTEHAFNFQDAEGSARRLLERRDDGRAHANLMFVGGRKRQKTDNKFMLSCFDTASGKKVWETDNLRFLGNTTKYTGDEWGFFEAFVHGDVVAVHGLYDVFAFNVKDGSKRWYFRVPVGFEIKHAASSGNVLVLCGQAETIALNLTTESQLGEVAWQEQETGDTYAPSYFLGDALVSVRKLPYNVTVRYRGTGKLMGRLELPDLTLLEKHPLFEEGFEELPYARAGRRIVVSDSWYYICVDVLDLRIVWKRLIDNNDPTQEPPMRFYLSQEHFAVLKKDYDMPGMYMFDANTGELLWRHDPKDGKTPKPMHAVRFQDGKAYGIEPHAGQGFYFVGLEAQTGKRLFRTEAKDYKGRPSVYVMPELLEHQALVYTQDNQDFTLRAFGLKDGKEAQKLEKKGVGPLGTHGRVSVNAQNARLMLLSKDELSF